MQRASRSNDHFTKQPLSFPSLKTNFSQLDFNIVVDLTGAENDNPYSQPKFDYPEDYTKMVKKKSLLGSRLLLVVNLTGAENDHPDCQPKFDYLEDYPKMVKKMSFHKIRLLKVVNLTGAEINYLGSHKQLDYPEDHTEMVKK